MRLTSRVLPGLFVVVMGLGLASGVRAQASPFVGSWNLTGTGPDAAFVYWLGVKEGDRLVGPEYRARLEGDRLVGRHTLRTGGRGGAAATERVVNWVGAKRPAF